MPQHGFQYYLALAETSGMERPYQRQQQPPEILNEIGEKWAKLSMSYKCDLISSAQFVLRT